uniref:Uncharacterized protein n=2 Tax=Schistosoma mansoni TaxID=6183 RepID=A0A5K4F9T9_SCHMA
MKFIMLVFVVFVLLTYSTFINKANHTEEENDEDIDQSKNEEEDKDEKENEHEDENEEKNRNENKAKEKGDEKHEVVWKKDKIKGKNKKKDKNKMKSENEDETVDSEHGMKVIYKVLKKSFKTGRMKMCKTIDTYFRKDDLDKKMLDIAKILSRRIEKRMEYLTQKLDDMLAYETS